MYDRTPAPGSKQSSPAPASSSAQPARRGEALDADLWSIYVRATGGLSPISMATAWFDWLAHAAASPGWRADTALGAAQVMTDSMAAWSQRVRQAVGDPAAGPLDRYERVLEEWRALYETIAAWSDRPDGAPKGVSTSHARQIAFSMRQVLEAAHPFNAPWSNPEAVRATIEQRGANLWRGYLNALEDAAALFAGPQHGENPDGLGDTMAATPGKVVYRNALIELIQYEPQTKAVHNEPVLFAPAWIMKYYILDLTPGASLIEYLVQSGFTVFAISWRNPRAEDRDMAFDDYRRLGVMAALDAIEAILPGQQVHGVGYCLGGTLLSVAAAAMARAADRRLATLSLFAAQTDFSEPGELALFIDEAQLSLLEAGMSGDGYLHGEQMAGAFALLRSRDLIWRRMQNAYYLGRRETLNELMAWNRDSTRMPYRMHSEYLRKFFLNNDFAQGRLRIDGKPVAPSDIRAPIFALGTETDHVAPWRSVYKIHLLADAEVTFALTSGGHNAGVVSPPGRVRRRHLISTKADCDYYRDPDVWREEAEERDGSWWPSWRDWLAERSSGKRAASSPERAALTYNYIAAKSPPPAAPGEYVRS